MFGRLAAVAALSVLWTGTLPAADPVIEWNNVLLDTIRATGGPPGPISRTDALVHVAIYDAVNTLDRKHEPYLNFLPCRAGANKHAAVASAAHKVLCTIHPTRRPVFDAALAASLAPIPNGLAKTHGIALGIASANAILAERSSDRSNAPPTYVVGTNPGDWRPTFPDYTPNPATPHWGNVEPWGILSNTQFRPVGPLGVTSMTTLLRSTGYAAQVNQVKSLGALNSTTRTRQQTEIAFFWANDVNGTYKPPGHLNHVTQVVSRNRNLTLEQNSRLFAFVNLAMADAGIVSWDAKYNSNIDLWRPTTAIRLANTDGNPATTADPNWEPLNPFQPPFPAYISGHATFGAAHSSAMAGYFGTDLVRFTIGTDDPYYLALGAPATRTYAKFSDAAWENAISRIYLGVHYTFDARDGNTAGNRIGTYITRNLLKPISRADIDADGRRDIVDLTMFLACFMIGDAAADIDSNGVLNVIDARNFSILFAGGTCN